MKTCLVTGGAGLIGSHLCERLLATGANVICLDDLSTGKAENISSLSKHPQFTFINQDVREPLELNEPIHEIYHLACPASPVHYQDKPIKTIKTNVIGTLNMLDVAHQNEAKFLLASTSEVYGDPLVHPQPETYNGNVNPIGPRSCYDEGKRVAETSCFDFHRQYGLDIKIARIFNTYGPNMAKNDGRVVSNFILQALSNQPIEIHGDGSQTRSFCYVSDMVTGLIELMAAKETGPINLGNDEEISMKSLATLIIDLSQSKSQLNFTPSREEDPQQRQPDLTKAKSSLNWNPQVDLSRGLLATIAYFSNESI